jgi:hypothetical protein
LQHLGLGITEQLGKGVVDAHEAMIQVGDDHRHIRVVKRIAPQLLAVAQRLFGAAFLFTQPLLRKRLRDSLAEPPEPVLAQIIAGALMHGGGGEIFADAAGNDDEWDVLPAGAQQLQGAQRAEVRHRVIGKDQLRLVGELLDKVRLRVDPLPIRTEAGFAQIVRQQLGVTRPVFKHQHPQWCRHERVPSSFSVHRISLPASCRRWEPSNSLVCVAQRLLSLTNPRERLRRPPAATPTSRARSPRARGEARAMLAAASCLSTESCLHASQSGADRPYPANAHIPIAPG